MDPMTGLGLFGIFLAIGLLIAEALLPGFFLAIPGTILLVMGLIALVAPGLFDYPILMFGIGVVALAISTVGTLYFYRSIAKPAPPETSSADAMIGKTGVVTVDTVPDTLKGKVRIDHQIWSAEADTIIPKGARIKVLNTEGVHLIVEKTEK